MTLIHENVSSMFHVIGSRKKNVKNDGDILDVAGVTTSTHFQSPSTEGNKEKKKNRPADAEETLRMT